MILFATTEYYLLLALFISVNINVVFFIGIRSLVNQKKNIKEEK
jgi:hypothetical protein